MEVDLSGGGGSSASSSIDFMTAVASSPWRSGRASAHVACARKSLAVAQQACTISWGMCASAGNFHACTAEGKVLRTCNHAPRAELRIAFVGIAECCNSAVA
jgi:hypothetical protein